MGLKVSAVQLTEARQAMMRAGRAIAAWHETYDVWLTATLGRPPMKLGTIDIDETDVQKGFAPNFGYVPFTLHAERDRHAGHQPAPTGVRTDCRSACSSPRARAAK